MDDEFRRLLASHGFTIERELGRGGMGAVYLARQCKLDRMVAIKCLLGDGPRDDGLWKRFVAEARLFRDLAHPSVVRVFDTELDGPFPFLVLEYVPGSRTLADAMASGPLGSGQSKFVLTHVLAALEYIHSKRIIHRDLKPANVLLGGDEQVKLIDFGIARVLDSDQTRQTRDGSLLGTLSYMPPEQMRGAEVTEAADVYSWALMSIEVLAGRLIFSGSSGPAVIPPDRRFRLPLPPVSKLIQGVDPRLDRLLSRCVDRDPGSRPTAGTALTEFRDISSHDDGVARAQHGRATQETLTGSPSRRSVRRVVPRTAEAPWPQVWLLPAILLALAALATISYVVRPERQPQPTAAQRDESSSDLLLERLGRSILERPGGILGVIARIHQHMPVDGDARAFDTGLDVALGTAPAAEIRELIRREAPGAEAVRANRRLLAALLEWQAVDDFATSMGIEAPFGRDQGRWLGPYATTTEFPALDDGSVVLGSRGGDRIKESRPGRWTWTLSHLPEGDPLLVLVFGNLHPKFLVRVTLNRSLTIGYRNASGRAGDQPYVIPRYRDVVHPGLSGREDYSRPDSLKGHVVLARRIPRDAIVTGLNTLDVSFARLPGRLPRGARTPSAMSEGGLWHGYLAFR